MQPWGGGGRAGSLFGILYKVPKWDPVFGNYPFVEMSGSHGVLCLFNLHPLLFRVDSLGWGPRETRNPSGTLLPFLGSGFPYIIYQQKKGYPYCNMVTGLPRRVCFSKPSMVTVLPEKCPRPQNPTCFHTST